MNEDIARTAEETLGEVRRANLYGRLYPHPRSLDRRRALHLLCAAGLAERFADTPTGIGGWFARPEDDEGSATL